MFKFTGRALTLVGLFLLGNLSSIAQEATTRPNFSGRWALDRDKSDDAVERVQAGFAERLAKGRNQMLQRYLAEVLVQLAIAAEEVEIRHTDKDIVIFDKADDLNIYYIDGKKHKRQDQDLGDFETVTEWQGNELVVKAKGKEAGEGVETFSMEDDQLVVSMVLKPKHFKSDIVAKFYYDRVE